MKYSIKPSPRISLPIQRPTRGKNSQMSSSTPRRPRRVSIACVACRQRRIRCLSDGTHEACERCLRRGMDCRYVPVAAQTSPGSTRDGLPHVGEHPASHDVSCAQPPVHQPSCICHIPILAEGWPSVCPIHQPTTQPVYPGPLPPYGIVWPTDATPFRQPQHVYSTPSFPGAMPDSQYMVPSSQEPTIVSNQNGANRVQDYPLTGQVPQALHPSLNAVPYLQYPSQLCARCYSSHCYCSKS